MSKMKLFLICLFTGIFGGHYFVIGKVNKGLLYLFTCGFFVFGWLKDLILILTTDFEQNIRTKDEQYNRSLQAQREKMNAKQQKLHEKAQQYQEEGIPYCPKCGSTHLTANKKGFGTGKAAAGLVVAGPVGGLLAGGIGSKKVIITCLVCGCQFSPHVK